MHVLFLKLYAKCLALPLSKLRVFTLVMAKTQIQKKIGFLERVKVSRSPENLPSSLIFVPRADALVARNVGSFPSDGKCVRFFVCRGELILTAIRMFPAACGILRRISPHRSPAEI